MLLLLPTLAALVLSITMIEQPSVDSNLQQLQVLSGARQQLIVYAASYLESYRPTGAGPGHLPCPDTDQTPNEYQVQPGLRGDGPNPPCGKHVIAVGRLPRHISHGSRRFAFHLEDKHNVWYAVDTRFINNPINRVVNPDTQARIRLKNAPPVAALVFIPRTGSRLWKQPPALIATRLAQVLQSEAGADALGDDISLYTVITPAALLTAVNKRVALWLHTHYQAQSLFACASPDQCLYRRLVSCDITERDRLRLMMFSQAEPVVCDGTPVDLDRSNRFMADARLDSVFYRRHWFYRNNWWRFVKATTSEQCAEAIVECHAVLTVVAGRQPIELKVLPL